MRYLPQTKDAREAMLNTIGAKDIEALYKDVPEQSFIKGKANLPDHKGELEVERIMSAYANQNHAAPDGPFFLGAGTYFHHVPATVDYIIQRSEYLTAYTPYQPEIAQGTLQMIFEFQTFIAQLTGQDIANASLYDGATATTEAALMAMRITKRKKIVIKNALHPHYKEVLDSYLSNFEETSSDFSSPPSSANAASSLPPAGGIEGGSIDEQTACVIIQSPDFYGTPKDIADLRKQCDAAGALLIVVVNEIVSLGMLPAPEMADIVCGEAQSIGIPMSYGGPHLGFFACKEKYLRQMPGRLCGMTEDADGKRGFVLTLSTREQHIRRDKATSNICTNQGLCALAFTVHMSLLGEDGFKHLAALNHEAACKLADAVDKVQGARVISTNFFNEFVVELSQPARQVSAALAGKGIIAGHPLGQGRLLMAATEMTKDEDITALCDALKEVLS